MKFTESHEWIRIENGIGTVGITAHAQKELGEVVYVELPAIGLQVKMAQEVAVLESTKAAADIYAPVGGEVIAVNQALLSNIHELNTSPESTGWLFQLKLNDLQELDELMDRQEYEKMVTHD